MTTFVMLLWLNLAMLPCTMAAADADQGVAPDCPSKASAERHGHGSRHASAAEMQHHGVVNEQADDGQDGGAHPCMSGDDCCALDEVLFSDNTNKLDRDADTFPPIAYEAICFDALTDSNCGHPATGPPTPFAGAVRLHALHCVYRN